MDQLVLLSRFVMVLRPRAAWAVVVAGWLASSGCNLNPRPEDPGFGEDPSGAGVLAGADNGAGAFAGAAGGSSPVIGPSEPPPFIGVGGSGGRGGVPGGGPDAGTTVEVVDEALGDGGPDAEADARPDGGAASDDTGVLTTDAG